VTPSYRDILDIDDTFDAAPVIGQAAANTYPISSADLK